MTTLHFEEYTSVRRYTSFRVSDEEIKELCEKYRKLKTDPDDFKDVLYNYLHDIKWDNQEDSEIVDEDTDDTDWCSDVDVFVNETVDKYESTLSVLGEFGNT